MGRSDEELVEACQAGEVSAFDVLVARVRVSANYIQAAFAGGGMGYADNYMKDPATAPLCEVKPGSVAARGSLEGLECRWQDIPSVHGETVSLMVRALGNDPARATAVYREVIAKVREVYGTDEACHPLTPPIATLVPALGARQLGSPTWGVTHNLGGFPSQNVAAVAVIGAYGA